MQMYEAFNTWYLDAPIVKYPKQVIFLRNSTLGNKLAEHIDTHSIN